MTHTHLTAPTEFIEADGVGYACRRFGLTRGVPLLFLQHFTGTMDGWDPAVVDGFARTRPVVLFDNAGVSRSRGTTPDRIEAMAEAAASFITALDAPAVDLLGFSLGGFVAQVVAERYPYLVRRIILAGTGPEGGEGIADLPRVVAEGQKATPADPRLYLLFARTDSSQRAGRAFIERQRQRTADRDPDSSTETIAAQQAAIVRWGGSPGPAASARLGRISHPALVVNGKTDVMVPSVNSIALFHGLPNAKLILYPDSGHGALFQHGDAFVREGDQFLDS